MTSHHSIADVAWAAGFFEGEGCIYIHPQRRIPRIYLRVTQVHEERLTRMMTVLGVGRINGPYKNGKSDTPLYVYSICRKHEVKVAMNLMWPYLGPTSRARLKELVDRVRGPM